MATANAWIALGGNLGDVRTAFGRAVSLLEAKGETMVARSSLYRTPPLGPPQADYLNAAVALRTPQKAEQLLQTLVEVETQLGRQRSIHWGPRTLDLDLLFFGERGEQISTEGPLILPHPEVARRAFVLAPLAEIAPSLRHPTLGQTVQELLNRLPEAERETARRLDIGWIDG